MEIQISRDGFSSALQLAQGIAERKGTSAILANVLLRTEGRGRVEVVATDLHVTVSAFVPCKVVREGAVTLGAKQLAEVVRSLPDESVAISETERHYASVVSGKAKFNIVGLPAKDFPKVQDPGKAAFASVSAEVLGEVIRKTYDSVSVDDTRHGTNGACLESDGMVLRMVSTDGHRLSKIERTLAGGPRVPGQFLIPRKGLGEIRRTIEGAKDPVGIAVASGHIFVRVADVLLACKLLDATFPPYEQVIPKRQSKTVDVNRADLAACLRRVSLMASDKTGGVKMKLDADAITVRTDDPQRGEGEDEIAAEYDGPALVVGLNSHYLVDALECLDDERVSLGFDTDLDPITVRSADGSAVYVIMPMRL